MDPELPLRGMNKLTQAVANQGVQPRFTMALFSLFAAFGIILAMAGIYSVLSYLVIRRTREIGVRMALGAGRGDVQKLFLKTGARLVGLGLVISKEYVEAHGGRIRVQNRPGSGSTFIIAIPMQPRGVPTEMPPPKRRAPSPTRSR